LSIIEDFRLNHRADISELSFTLHVIRHSPLTILGFGIVSGLVVMAVLAPIIIPYPQDAYAAMHPENALMSVSIQHPFGTDELGRDLFSRCIYGARISLQVGVIVILVAAITGVVLGGLSGYYGGVIDQAIMRLTDAFLSIPSLILALAVAATLGPGLNNAMAAIAVTWWPWYARLVRGQVLEIKQELYVEAARAMGGSNVYIIFKHIMPNALGPILVNASMDIGFAILTAASLGFLGLGAQAPAPEWGLIIGTGRKYLPTQWWYTTFPGVMIFLSVLGFNLLGDGLRDLLDPRMRRKGRVKK
jgi:peptide/nickel transport system permease protein